MVSLLGLLSRYRRLWPKCLGACVLCTLSCCATSSCTACTICLAQPLPKTACESKVTPSALSASFHWRMECRSVLMRSAAKRPHGSRTRMGAKRKLNVASTGSFAQLPVQWKAFTFRIECQKDTWGPVFIMKFFFSLKKNEGPFFFSRSIALPTVWATP